MNKITYFGSEKDISEAISVLKQHENIKTIKESDARLQVQQLIDTYHIKASILINGQTVWSKDRILKNLEQIIKLGVLFNQQDQTTVLSHYFYQFLHTTCGSTPKHDIHGWIHRYPNLEAFKAFFKCNEWGKPVLEWIPKERADARAIVEAIEKMLFPFESYMRTRE